MKSSNTILMDETFQSEANHTQQIDTKSDALSTNHIIFSSKHVKIVDPHQEGSQLNHANHIPKASSYKLIPSKTLNQASDNIAYSPNKQHKKNVSQAVISTKDKLIGNQIRVDSNDNSNCIIY